MTDEEDDGFEILPPLQPGGKFRIRAKERPIVPEPVDPPKVCVLCEEVRDANCYTPIDWNSQVRERGLLCVYCCRPDGRMFYRGLPHSDDRPLSWRDHVHFSDAAILVHLIEREIKNARTARG